MQNKDRQIFYFRVYLKIKTKDIQSKIYDACSLLIYGKEFAMYRDNTKVIQIGNRKIGGGNPILIQSMTNVPTEDVEACVAQILRLEEAGCEIIRCTVPNMEAAKAIAEIKKQIHIPLVADIHFDYKMAIAAMENGADKIRINPGNIGSKDNVAAVVLV